MNLPGFEADILAEPAALRALAARERAGDGPLRPLEGLLEGVRRVVLLGMGSSRYAALDAAVRLRAAGLDAAAGWASADVREPPGPDALVLAISATGGSEETLEALAWHRGRSRTAVVTNAPARVAGLADAVVPLGAGPEPGGIHCRTFQATVAVLHLLTARLTGTGAGPDDLERAASAQDALVARAWLGDVADALEGAPVDVIGPASRMGSVEQSALMLREAPRIASTAYETGDWPHVGVYLSRHGGYRALLLPGGGREGEVVRWAGERGAVLVAVGRAVEGATHVIPVPHADDPVVASLVETSAVELVAAELWRRAGGG